MKTITLLMTLATVAVLAIPGTAASPNDEQSGFAELCLDYNVLWAADGVHSPLASIVSIEAGSAYVATSDAGTPYVDFYDAGGVFLAEGGATGTVPASAAYGIVCVGQFNSGWPTPPRPAASWTYQDGF